MSAYERNITSANGSDPFVTLLSWKQGLGMEPQDKPIEMNLEFFRASGRPHSMN